MQSTSPPMPEPTYLILSTPNTLSPTKQPLRILTQYYNKPANEINMDMGMGMGNSGSRSMTGSRDRERDRKNQNIFQLYVYTDLDVYFAIVGVRHLNRELNWNDKFVALLKKSLSGGKNSAIAEFNAQKPKLKISHEFQQSSIRILLFEIELACLHKDPFLHAQQLLLQISQKHKEKQHSLNTTKRILQSNQQKMQALGKEVMEQHQFQMGLAKDKFVAVVNEVKKKLRPHFGVEERREDEEGSQTRTLYRIKGGQSDGVAKRESDNLFNLFQ